MRIKLTLHRPDASRSDVVVTADATATVRDVAEALFVGDPVRAGSRPPDRLTLQVSPDAQAGVPVGGQGRVLVPSRELGESGLRSGATVAIVRVPEPFDEPGHERHPAVAVLRVLDGPDAGREFPLPAGTSHIGRGDDVDVYLSDPQVSKQHARVTVGERVDVVDTDSANGLVIGGRRVTRVTLAPSDALTIGDSVVSIVPLHAPRPPLPTDPVVEFNRSPRVVPRFEPRTVSAPRPPRPRPAAPLPWLLIVLPLLVGGVLFAVTQNVLALILASVLTPVLVVAVALEARAHRRRAEAGHAAQFGLALEAARRAVGEAHTAERAVRLAQTPSTDEVVDAVRRRDGLVWTHRPEHDAFLTVRLGMADGLSRTTVDVPDDDMRPDLWQEVDDLRAAATTLVDVPVVGRLRASGGLGVAGDWHQAEQIAVSAIVQLVGLHSPAELVVAAVTSRRAAATWEWLKWLPHVSSPHSPLGQAEHLADDEASAALLVSRLEDLVEARGVDLGAPVRPRGDLDAWHEAEADPPTHLPAVVLVVESGAVADRARLTRLVEHGADAGVHVVWVAPTVAELPAACRTFVVAGGRRGATTGRVRIGRLDFPVVCETVPVMTAREVARTLAPMVDVGAPVADETDLPSSVSYLTLAKTPLDPEEILGRWRENGSAGASSGGRRRPPDLRALVGRAEREPLYLDLRAQGPHALVGGTTGSGKSEFLQAWLLGLALAYSPEHVTFLLVDVAGGSAFAECVNLPHTVGHVFDPAPREIRRVLTSLRAEIAYRERLLAGKRVRDLAALERAGDPEAPPNLVIVVDDLAPLITGMPGFASALADVAQRGRPLGVHLVLATAHPAGVVSAELRANANLRIALRTADEADSTDLLGVPIAAHVAGATPGRGAVRTGVGRVTMFQAGRVGGWTPSVHVPRIEIQELPFDRGALWPLPFPEGDDDEVRGQADLSRAVDAVTLAVTIGSVPTPRPPWLPSLAPTYDLAYLPHSRTDGSLVFGVEDDPSTQSHPTVAWEPDKDGNLVFYGTVGTGKSTALRTIAVAAAITARGVPVLVYAIDDVGALRLVEDLPHVGAVVPCDDAVRVARMMRMIRDLVDERTVRYGAVHAPDIVDYRARAGQPDEPRVLLLVDGFEAFRESYERRVEPGHDVWEAFQRVAAEGRRVGVHVALTAHRPSSVPLPVAATVGRNVVLRLAASDDYEWLGVHADVLRPSSPPGRGLVGGNEVQLAVFGGSPSVTVQARELDKLRDAMEKLDFRRAPGVTGLPEACELSALPVFAGDRPAFAVEDQDLGPVGLPAYGTFMLAGPARSGRTTAFVTIGQAVKRAGGSRLVYLSPHRTDISTLDLWDVAASTVEDALDVVAELDEVLVRGTIPPGRLVVMVENLTDFARTVAQGPLDAFIRSAVRARQFVLGEAETIAWSRSWALSQPFRTGRTGLLLSPGEVDGDALLGVGTGRVGRSALQPGRGYLVQDGHVTHVQVALPE